jgi:hypothetical protein
MATGPPGGAGLPVVLRAAGVTDVPAIAEFQTAYAGHD